MIDAVLVAILVALVVERIFDSTRKSDRAEEIRSATAEGVRCGFAAHKELTDKARDEVDQLYNRAYSELIFTETSTISPDGMETAVNVSFDDGDSDELA